MSPFSVLSRVWDSDIAWSFRHSPIAVVSAVVLLILLVGAMFCTLLAPSNPFDLASLNLMDSFTGTRAGMVVRPISGKRYSLILRLLQLSTPS